MRLDVTHETRYRYGAPVDVAHHVAFLHPRAGGVQSVAGTELAIEPAPRERQSAPDAFGNLRTFFALFVPHATLRVVARSRVEIAPRARVEPAASVDWSQVRRRLRQHAGDMMRTFDIRATGPDARFSSLSGGNQHKAVHARELSSRNLIFLLAAQPTRGLDVGAIEAVYVSLECKKHKVSRRKVREFLERNCERGWHHVAGPNGVRVVAYYAAVLTEDEKRELLGIAGA